MKNNIIPIFEYGYYGYNVFELPSQTLNVSMLPKKDITSRMSLTFNMGSKTALMDVNINTGDYYQTMINEGDYYNLLDFIKVNQVSNIPRISNTVKILMYYSITTVGGRPVDSGVRIAEVPMSDCIEVLPIVSGITAPYRIAKYISTEFIIDRFNPNGGGVNIRSLAARTPFAYQELPGNFCREVFVFYINEIKILGTEVGKERHIPNSMNGGQYAVGSQTITDIEKNSIELFSTSWYDIAFNDQEIPGYVNTISVPIEVVTPMIVTTDTADIDKLLAVNAGAVYPGDETGEVIVDMFKPLVRRPHCPGTLPHDIFKYWDRKPDHGHHHGHGPCEYPINPGPEWPHHGKPVTIDVTKIDENTPPGVYSNNGIMKYSWRELVKEEVITQTYKGDHAIVSTVAAFDVKNRNARIYSSDIGPILVVPDPKITEGMVIGENAFFGCENLEEIYLPKQTHRIESHAFYGCKKLERVHIAENGLNGLHYIGDNAFMNCTSLRSISTSLALDTIGERSFYHCSLLRLVVPPSVGSIGENAFHEVFHIICSPKLNLGISGINPKDVIFFSEDSPYYNPEDYTDDNPADGEGDNNGNEEPGNGGNSEPGSTDPNNPGNTTESDETESGNPESGSGNTEDGFEESPSTKVEDGDQGEV